MAKIKLGDENKEAENLIPPKKSDGSMIGVNYADAYLKGLTATLEDGRKVSIKRRGLKVTVSIGDKKGESLMRKIEQGPDVKKILQAALADAAKQAGAELSIENGAVFVSL